LSRINLEIGTRDTGVDVPIEYEIPRAVVAEAIVNAVAHRDYTSNGSVQVMLFRDRLEIWNPPVFRTFLQHPYKLLIINMDFVFLGVAKFSICILENLKIALGVLVFR